MKGVKPKGSELLRGSKTKTTGYVLSYLRITMAIELMLGKLFEDSGQALDVTKASHPTFPVIYPKPPVHSCPML